MRERLDSALRSASAHIAYALVSVYHVALSPSSRSPTRSTLASGARVVCVVVRGSVTYAMIKVFPLTHAPSTSRRTHSLWFSSAGEEADSASDYSEEQPKPRPRGGVGASAPKAKAAPRKPKGGEDLSLQAHRRRAPLPLPLNGVA